MQLNEFTYNLPSSNIACYPPTIRGSTKLLVLNRKTGLIDHSSYNLLPKFLSPGDVVVLNNTEVIKARLQAKNKSGDYRELFLVESHNDDDFYQRKALYRGKIHENEVLQIGTTKITVEKIVGNGVAIINSSTDLLELAEKFGSIPLPPYLKRESELIDTERYQTVFAEKKGSVAAPTASLNFTKKLKDQLEDSGIQVAYLTLHVGLGTFLPIRSKSFKDHKMHSEYFNIPAETVRIIREAKKNKHNIVAIGTTVTRTLEFSANDIIGNKNTPLIGEADIFIYPGYKFRVVNQMLTNFHAPKSTVLMMATAFAGWSNLKHAYNVASENDYKFLSYGDSMLIQ